MVLNRLLHQHRFLLQQTKQLQVQNFGQAYNQNIKLSLRIRKFLNLIVGLMPFQAFYKLNPVAQDQDHKS